MQRIRKSALINSDACRRREMVVIQETSTPFPMAVLDIWCLSTAHYNSTIESAYQTWNLLSTFSSSRSTTFHSLTKCVLKSSEECAGAHPSDRAMSAFVLELHNCQLEHAGKCKMQNSKEQLRAIRPLWFRSESTFLKQGIQEGVSRRCGHAISFAVVGQNRYQSFPVGPYPIQCDCHYGVPYRSIVVL